MSRSRKAGSLPRSSSMSALRTEDPRSALNRSASRRKLGIDIPPDQTEVKRFFDLSDMVNQALKRACELEIMELKKPVEKGGREWKLRASILKNMTDNAFIAEIKSPSPEQRNKDIVDDLLLNLNSKDQKRNPDSEVEIVHIDEKEDAQLKLAQDIANDIEVKKVKLAIAQHTSTRHVPHELQHDQLMAIVNRVDPDIIAKLKNGVSAKIIAERAKNIAEDVRTRAAILCDTKELTLYGRENKDEKQLSEKEKIEENFRLGSIDKYKYENLMKLHEETVAKFEQFKADTLLLLADLESGKLTAKTLQLAQNFHAYTQATSIYLKAPKTRSIDYMLAFVEAVVDPRLSLARHLYAKFTLQHQTQVNIPYPDARCDYFFYIGTHQAKLLADAIKQLKNSEEYQKFTSELEKRVSPKMAKIKEKYEKLTDKKSQEAKKREEAEIHWDVQKAENEYVAKQIPATCMETAKDQSDIRMCLRLYKGNPSFNPDHPIHGEMYIGCVAATVHEFKLFEHPAHDAKEIASASKKTTSVGSQLHSIAEHSKNSMHGSPGASSSRKRALNVKAQSAIAHTDLPLNFQSAFELGWSGDEPKSDFENEKAHRSYLAGKEAGKRAQDFEEKEKGKASAPTGTDKVTPIHVKPGPVLSCKQAFIEYKEQVEAKEKEEKLNAFIAKNLNKEIATIVGLRKNKGEPATSAQVKAYFDEHKNSEEKIKEEARRNLTAHYAQHTQIYRRKTLAASDALHSPASRLRSVSSTASVGKTIGPECLISPVSNTRENQAEIQKNKLSDSQAQPTSSQESKQAMDLPGVVATSQRSKR